MTNNKAILGDRFTAVIDGNDEETAKRGELHATITLHGVAVTSAPRCPKCSNELHGRPPLDWVCTEPECSMCEVIVHVHGVYPFLGRPEHDKQ